ncbi:hypothetical protein K6Q96_22605 [Grimontia kaedaensis]|uniref:Tetratricopeptide repeat protein n=1 Tax=Grimontia kaedaensis TaxID=2872157 RepID=A0ABY4WZX6_9GAMM|nr:hypothetical protein [Grimontia kaedaensis]USH04520.1 hypothetical protein K6Q96_22605 [Grimontia kaedaensis]
MNIKDNWLSRIALFSIVVFIAATPAWLNQVNAGPTQKTLQDAFMDASTGNSDAGEHVLSTVEDLLIQYPEDALLTAYYGSTMSMKARDAWLPWNRQKFSQIGVDSLNKSLNQLSDESFDKPYYGLNEGLYIQSLAAITFINLPESLDQRERGFAMLKDMMASEELGYYPFGPRAWIHIGAVKAAIDMEDTPTATKWANEMQRLAPTHPYTQQAIELVEN